jgi:hypothetical protein
MAHEANCDTSADVTGNDGNARNTATITLRQLFMAMSFRRTNFIATGPLCDHRCRDGAFAKRWLFGPPGSRDDDRRPVGRKGTKNGLKDKGSVAYRLPGSVPDCKS